MIAYSGAHMGVFRPKTEILKFTSVTEEEFIFRTKTKHIDE